MLHGNLGVDCVTTSEVLYPNLKVRLGLIRALLYCYVIGHNRNVSLGIVDCLHYTRLVDLKDDYHKKRMDMLLYTPVEYNQLETLATTFIIPAR